MHTGSPNRNIPGVPNNTSPTSARTFNCASYSFFGSADSRNDHSIESPHSAEAKASGAKDALDKSEAGSDSAPDGSVHASDHALTAKQGSESAGEEAGVSASSQGQAPADEEHCVPTDEEILMSYLNLGPGF